MKTFYIIYLRKSRSDGEFESVEEVLQRHETQLQNFATQTIGSKIPEDDIYREIGSGESIEEREKIKEVLQQIQDPNCKGVFVIEPQRLSRGDLNDLGSIISAFRFSKTKIMTPTKVFDLENKYDREFFERELLRGKDYVEYTKEILMRGRAASAREGNWISSIAPYGYDRLKLGKGWTLAINEKEAEMVRMIFDMYVNHGMGANSIAHKLNELGEKPRMSERFSPTAIRQILCNEVYIGKIRWNAKPVTRVFEDGKVVKKRVRNKNYQLIDGKHEAIISEELFYKAQERKGRMTREKGSTELRNIYAGLIKCKKCGGAIAMQGHKNRKDRYYCRTGIYCNNKGINTDVLNEAIIKALRAYLEDFKIKLEDGNKSEVEAHQRMIERLEKDLKALEVRQEELYDLLEDKTYTKQVFTIRNEKLAKERETLKEKLKDARQNMPSIESNEQKYYSLFEALNAIENPLVSNKMKNILLKQIVEVIYYNKDENDPTTGATLETSNFEIEVILK